MRSATPKIHKKSRQNPPKIVPKPFPNPPSKKDASKTRPKIHFFGVLGEFLEFLDGPGPPKIEQYATKSKLKKNMFFETSFSSFFVFLATENDVKIELLSLLFRKRRFCENHHETLAVRTKIKVRI